MKLLALDFDLHTHTHTHTQYTGERGLNFPANVHFRAKLWKIGTLSSWDHGLQQQGATFLPNFNWVFRLLVAAPTVDVKEGDSEESKLTLCSQKQRGVTPSQGMNELFEWDALSSLEWTVWTYSNTLYFPLAIIMLHKVNSQYEKQQYDKCGCFHDSLTGRVFCLSTQLCLWTRIPGVCREDSVSAETYAEGAGQSMEYFGS